MIEELKRQLIRDEGVRLKAYRDTVGKLTIGVGHNLDDKPISERAAAVILEDDIADVAEQLDTLLPWAATLDEPRRGVLANMLFNLGGARLLGFHDTLNMVKLGRYTEAAEEMMNSRWAAQVGPRAVRLSEQMKSGVWQ